MVTASLLIVERRVYRVIDETTRILFNATDET